MVLTFPADNPSVTWSVLYDSVICQISVDCCTLQTDNYNEYWWIRARKLAAR